MYVSRAAYCIPNTVAHDVMLAPFLLEQGRPGLLLAAHIHGLERNQSRDYCGIECRHDLHHMAG
jgi:hypothetical protein